MAIRNAAGWLYLLILILPVARDSAISGETPDTSTITIVPEQIRIGAFYNGVEVKVAANVASCDGAVIVLEGGSEEITLNKKGRVAVIWMNVAKITISGIPRVYILASSDELDEICSRDTQEEFRLGVESLRIPMDIKSDQPLTGAEFDQFLKLKIENGTYNTNNKVKLESTPLGELEVSSILPIPSKMPPGVYEIKLYCFRQGRVVEMQSAGLKIDMMGLPCAIMNLAEKNAAMYGFMAIVAAMMAGVIMGIVFSSLPGNKRRY